MRPRFVDHFQAWASRGEPGRAARAWLQGCWAPGFEPLCASPRTFLGPADLGIKLSQRMGNITGRSSGKKRHRKISLDNTWVSPVKIQELQVAATAVKVVATEPWEVFQSICTDRVWQWYRHKIYMLFKLLCSNNHENSKVNSY